MSWLGFSAPAWLAGLAALVVPAVIHLLSRGRQRRVPVGSVRWLAAAETLRARRVRPSRWWLLALRCLLLAAVVLALAGPRLGIGAGSEAGWLLVAPEVVANRARLEPGNEVAYEAMEAALAAGSQLRWLTPGMPRGDLAAPPPDLGEGLWSLLHEADGLAPAGAGFVVVATDRVSTLAGARGAIGRTVEWHGVTDRAQNRWIERAGAIGDDRLAVVVGASSGTGTRFERLEIGAEDQLPTGLELSPDRDAWRLALAEGGSVAADDSLVVPGSTAALGVAILFSAEREADTRYLRAGLEAVEVATSRPLRVRLQEVDGDAAAVEEEGLLFWLAAEPVPQPLLDEVARGGVLVSDALGRFEFCDSALWLPAASSARRVDRCGPVDRGKGGESETGAAAVWSGADGRPLLVGERVGDGTWLRFASRWNPGWTDLVLAPQFPAWLLRLVEDAAAPAASSRLAASDRRSAAALAAPRQAATRVGEVTGREIGLSSWLWLLAFALAAGERWLALGSAS